DTGVIVTNGLFTVTIDFGSSVWNGQTNWLQIGVETNGFYSFTTLTPLQELTPVPYAIFAEGANAAGLNGTLPASSLGGSYGNAVTLNNAGNSFNGIFSGNGSGLTDLSDVWYLTGNSGTTPGPNYLG